MAKGDKGVTAIEIKQALAKKHGNREFYITEVKNGPTGVAPGELLQFDAVAIYKSWSRPQIRGYEIKTSRSDFLRDAKYSRYMPYFHEFYFVTPTGLVQRQEVEDTIGLMWYNPGTGNITTKKKAVWRNIDISPEMLLYVIMNRLDSDRLPFTSDKAEYWRAWVDGKISNRELGYRVRTKLLEQLEKQEQELKRLRSSKELQDEITDIDKVLDKHGIWHFGDRASALDKALNRGYPRELDNLERGLQQAAASMERIKSIYAEEATNEDRYPESSPHSCR